MQASADFYTNAPLWQPRSPISLERSFTVNSMP
jgi:hypothetical protein